MHSSCTLCSWTETDVEGSKRECVRVRKMKATRTNQIFASSTFHIFILYTFLSCISHIFLSNIFLYIYIYSLFTRYGFFTVSVILPNHQPIAVYTVFLFFYSIGFFYSLFTESVFLPNGFSLTKPNVKYHRIGDFTVYGRRQ